MTEDDFELLMGTRNLWKKKLVSPKSDHPDAKSQASNAADESFDDAMRRAMRVPPPPSGEKAKKKVRKKKRR
jgi:hypothetical protein